MYESRGDSQEGLTPDVPLMYRCCPPPPADLAPRPTCTAQTYYASPRPHPIHSPCPHLSPRPTCIAQTYYASPRPYCCGDPRTTGCGDSRCVARRVPDPDLDHEPEFCWIWVAAGIRIHTTFILYSYYIHTTPSAVCRPSIIIAAIQSTTLQILT